MTNPKPQEPDRRINPDRRGPIHPAPFAGYDISDWGNPWRGSKDRRRIDRCMALAKPIEEELAELAAVVPAHEWVNVLTPKQKDKALATAQAKVKELEDELRRFRTYGR